MFRVLRYGAFEISYVDFCSPKLTFDLHQNSSLLNFLFSLCGSHKQNMRFAAVTHLEIQQSVYKGVGGTNYRPIDVQS